MSKRNLSIIGFLTVLMLLSSCASRKSYVYLNDMEFEKMYDMLPRPEAVVRSNDRLKILVTSTDFPVLAAPFNIKLGSVQVREDGSVASMGVYNNEGYLVDIDGNIEFPKLGKLHVDGLKLSEVKELVRSKIVEGGYINDPIVVAELINFQYTVLGATGSNGVYKVEGDRINLIEAIAKAGNLTSRARLDRVNVIRETDGGRIVYTHDIRDKEIFDSPAFYLQQNDIVYVEPKYKKKDTEDRGIQYTTLILSITSSLTSILWYLDRN